MSGTLGLAFAGWVATRTAAAEDRAVLILVLFASVLVWQMTGSFYWSAFEWRPLGVHQGAWVALDGWTTVAALLLMPVSVLVGSLLRLASE